MRSAYPCVESVLKGYNSTIMAYGQTGTGKTFTMEGDAVEPGIYSRALQDIFAGSHSIKRSGGQMFVQMSYLQVYLESISDLLKPSAKPLTIRENTSINSSNSIQAQKVGCSVQGLSVWAVSCADEGMALIERGRKLRCCASTRLNIQSSRSHSVLIITVRQVHADGSESVSKLNLVDLAGSERVRITGATGARLKEGKKINLSLSALGNVIAALTEASNNFSNTGLGLARTGSGQFPSAAHIPYRSSKLTRILEDSLGGNCVTTFLATIAPTAAHFGETLSTLKFASRARAVRNDPQPNHIPSQMVTEAAPSEVSSMHQNISGWNVTHFENPQQHQQSIIDKQQIEIARLRKELSHATSAVGMSPSQSCSNYLSRCPSASSTNPCMSFPSQHHPPPLQHLSSVPNRSPFVSNSKINDDAVMQSYHADCSQSPVSLLVSTSRPSTVVKLSATTPIAHDFSMENCQFLSSTPRKIKPSLNVNFDNKDEHPMLVDCKCNCHILNAIDGEKLETNKMEFILQEVYKLRESVSSELASLTKEKSDLRKDHEDLLKCKAEFEKEKKDWIFSRQTANVHKSVVESTQLNHIPSIIAESEPSQSSNPYSVNIDATQAYSQSFVNNIIKSGTTVATNHYHDSVDMDKMRKLLFKQREAIRGLMLKITELENSSTSSSMLYLNTFNGSEAAVNEDCILQGGFKKDVANGQQHDARSPVASLRKEFHDIASPFIPQSTAFPTGTTMGIAPDKNCITPKSLITSSQNTIKYSPKIFLDSNSELTSNEKASILKTNPFDRFFDSSTKTDNFRQPTEGIDSSKKLSINYSKQLDCSNLDINNSSNHQYFDIPGSKRLPSFVEASSYYGSKSTLKESQAFSKVEQMESNQQDTRPLLYVNNSLKSSTLNSLCEGGVAADLKSTCSYSASSAFSFSPNRIPENLNGEKNQNDFKVSDINFTASAYLDKTLFQIRQRIQLQREANLISNQSIVSPQIRPPEASSSECLDHYSLLKKLTAEDYNCAQAIVPGRMSLSSSSFVSSADLNSDTDKSNVHQMFGNINLSGSKEPVFQPLRRESNTHEKDHLSLSINSTSASTASSQKFERPNRNISEVSNFTNSSSSCVKNAKDQNTVDLNTTPD